jgi:hypothetical protein
MSDGARKRRQKRRTLPAMHAEQITPITPITPITSIGQRPLVKVLTALAAWIAAVLLVAATFAAGPGQVQDSTEATPADAAITQRVENALAKDPFLRSQEIYVETQDGVVNLTGFVRSLDGIARAEELARGVRGVSAVRNGLRVANRPSQA